MPVQVHAVARGLAAAPAVLMFHTERYALLLAYYAPGKASFTMCPMSTPAAWNPCWALPISEPKMKSLLETFPKLSSRRGA